MTRYYDAMEFNNKNDIYTSYLHDYYRYIITRWRLSNHNLKIETDRYVTPIIPREERTCELCNVLEDESHVIFKCPRYNLIREQYRILLTKNNNISKFLNPTISDANETAKYLHDIEKLRN